MMWLLLILGIIILLVIWNFINRARTYKSMEKDFKKMNLKNLSKEKYARKCYDFVAANYTRVSKTWLKYPWRNFYYRDVWKKSNYSVPCLIQDALFRHCLEKKFLKNEVKLLITKNFAKGIIIHFYSKIKLKGKWVDVDVWGKKWGIPFGKNVNNTKLSGTPK